MSAPADDFAWWRAALAGEKPPVHEGEPQCGYYKLRDRRGHYAHIAAIKRPFVACAIWRDAGGDLQAEFAGSPSDPENLWPYVARFPIPYETYQHWHANDAWPLEAA